MHVYERNISLSMYVACEYIHIDCVQVLCACIVVEVYMMVFSMSNSLLSYLYSCTYSDAIKDFVWCVV